MKPVVGIIMGSDSDLSVMQEAVKVLKQFEVPHEVGVYSAHRSPHRTLGHVRGPAWRDADRALLLRRPERRRRVQPAVRRRDGEEGGVKVGEAIRLLERDGWILVATGGSHRQYRHGLKEPRRCAMLS